MNREKLLQNPLPVDRVAARVVCGKGEHWSPLKKSKVGPNWGTMSEPPPAGAGAAVPVGAIDYSGMRRGRMTVIRRESDAIGSTHGSVWLARCDCGNFEFRRPHRWRKKMAYPDSCSTCADRAYALTGSFVPK